MSLGSQIENQLFAVRRVVLASGWRQGLTSLFIGELARDLCGRLDVNILRERRRGQRGQFLFWLLMLLALCYSCVSAGVSAGPEGQ